MAAHLREPAWAIGKLFISDPFAVLALFTVNFEGKGQCVPVRVRDLRPGKGESGQAPFKPFLAIFPGWPFSFQLGLHIAAGLRSSASPKPPDRRAGLRPAWRREIVLPTSRASSIFVA